MNTADTAIQFPITMKMRRHRTGSGTKHTGRIPITLHHHENKRVRSEERAVEKARKVKISQVVDSPMPLIDIGIEKISEIIKSVTGIFEDSFQDAWVSVIETGASTEDEIRQIANECSQKNAKEVISDSYKQRSIDEPLGHGQDSSEDFTLKDILVSPIDRSGSEDQYIASSTGKINKKGNVALDDEVVKAIKAKYPHDPLTHAIRKLASLPPPNRKKLGWHKWEDAIIKVRYPWGGSRAVMVDVYRTEAAIVSRAKQLGIIRGKLNGYKPCPDWLNIREVAEKIGKTWKTAERFINEGVIQSIRIPNYHQGHDGVFVTPEAIKDYDNRKEIIKQERKRKHIEATQKTIAEKKLAKQEQAKALKEAENKIKLESVHIIAGKTTSLKLEQSQLKDIKRDVNVAQNRLVVQRKEIKEQRVILNEQKASLRKEKAGWIKEQRVILNEQKASMSSLENNLNIKETQLQEKEMKLSAMGKSIEGAKANYELQRNYNLNKAITELKESPQSWKVARKGDKTHYVLLKDGGLVSLCRKLSSPMPVDTIIKYNYDPFVEGEPSCKKCLALKEAQTGEG
ncbi:hypothetical protein LCGC14_0884410 [marine sediment metagenome]|uniref:Uncharacterized protein n=1 Tax=marine sediment metagenome TaxID=412755 RepID=A0A0F9RKI2_9ZZZZ